MKEMLLEIMFFSVFIPAVVGLFRWKNMDYTFRPFVLTRFVGCISEIISHILAAQNKHTFNVSIYYLVISLLLLWFFQQQGLFKRYRHWPWIIAGAYVVFWFAETLAYTKLTRDNSYFYIFFAFVTVLMSIAAINRLLVGGQQKLLKNALFLICTGLILTYTQGILVRSFWTYGLRNMDFLRTIYTVLVYVNFIANLLYALAILWAPKKQPSLLPS